jgi:DNA-binding CsgD family transcriptional regulator
MSSPTIIGRDAELERLEAAWRVTLSGEPQLLLVSGEAGIGKTRLAGEFAERVRRSGGRVLSGVCIDLREGGLPYAPIRQTIRAITRTEDRQRVEALREGLTAVLPDVPSQHAATALDEQDRRVRLFESLLHLFQELAEVAPVLLIVDDVQWADQATLDLLTFLARNLMGVPVLELLTFRDDRLMPDDPLQGFLIGQGSGIVREWLTLSRLNQADVAAQIAGIVESPPDPQLVETVFERSDGNPFFVEELLAAGMGHRDRVPPTVRELLLSRIMHLPTATRQLLRLAAVAGRTVSHETLAKIAAVDERALSDDLRTAVDARVLEPDEDGYTYRHTLLREALYNDLLPWERQATHRTYAEVLATGDRREPSIVGAIATHHDLGGEPERALPAFVEAAEAAERSFAFADAERYLRRAVELWDVVDDPTAVLAIDKVTLLSRAVEAALAVEDTDRAIPYAEAVLELVDPREDPARAGLLLSLLGRALWTAGKEAQSHAAFSAALRTVPPEPPSRERVEALAYYAAQLATEGRFTEAKATAEEAIQVARTVGAATYACRPLLTRGSVTARLGDLMRGLELIAEAEAIARDHGLAVEIMRVYLHRGRALQAYAAWEAAWRNYVHGAAEAPKFGMARRYGWRFQVLAARMLFWLGRWGDARDLLREAREQWTGGVLTLPLLLIASGQWDAAKRWFEHQHSRWRSDGAGLLQQPEARVEFATWLGAYDDALDYCSEGLALVSRSEDPLPAARLCVAGLRAHADRWEAGGGAAEPPAHALDLQERLQRLAAAREPRPDGWGRELAARAATGTAECSRLRGGDPALWEAADQAWSDLSMPYPAAYARFRQGQGLLTTAGDREHAVPLLRTAYAVARELGARPLMGLIEECATRGGLALVESTAETLDDRSDIDDLTRRERQVLDLLLEGYSNRAIGEALYIAERTASVHVSRILRKLGVSSRGEAIGRILRDRGEGRSS